MYDPTFNNFDPKDLYDPRDPHLYKSKYAELLRQTLAAKIHQIWCEWAASMIDQNLIESSKVPDLIKVLVPYHSLTPDAQRDHLIRAEQVIAEFLQWQLVAQSLKRGGPTKGKQV
jgi:hypothetical protein